jgi:hypothetical protein
MSYTKPTGTSVHIVQVQGCEPDVFDSQESATGFAYHSVLEMMCEDDEDRFKGDKGVDFSSASQEDVIDWWNDNNPSCIVDVSEFQVLTIR